jgi:hypothetical protein
LLLQNENTRAVGNMGVNARGDLLDSTNTVIEQKTQTVQRQYQKQTASTPRAEIHTSSRAAKAAAAGDQPEAVAPEIVSSAPDPVVSEATIVTEAPVVAEPVVAKKPAAELPGLAGALARSRLVKQEREKSAREQMQDQGLRKI